MLFLQCKFFVEQGKFTKLKLNNKRIRTIFGLAVDYVFCSANVNCDIEDCLSLEFIEDGEFVFLLEVFLSFLFLQFELL